MTSADSAVEQIERRLLQKASAARDELAKEFARCSVTLEAHPFRSAGSGDSYELAISCILPDKSASESDLVELEITFFGLDSAPTIGCADVVWGHGSGAIEAELFTEPARLTPAVWEKLDDGFRQLVSTLRTAIARGRPPD